MKNKGITLIALVITIIIMLILVAVTVSYSIKSGMIDKVSEAKFKQQREQDRETLQNWVIGESFFDEESEEILCDLEKVAIIARENKWTVTTNNTTYESPKKNKFIVDKNGKVTFIDEEEVPPSEKKAFISEDFDGYKYLIVVEENDAYVYLFSPYIDYVYRAGWNKLNLFDEESDMNKFNLIDDKMELNNEDKEGLRQELGLMDTDQFTIYYEGAIINVNKTKWIFNGLDLIYDPNFDFSTLKEKYELEDISNSVDYTGYYADTDGDGIPDGIIFLDLMDNEIKDITKQWQINDGIDNNDEEYKYSYKTITNSKEYVITKVNAYTNYGPKQMISAKEGSTGNDRFYVMELNKSISDSASWNRDEVDTQYSAEEMTEIKLGTGKDKTKKMMEETELKNNANNFWSKIEDKVAKGWFVPSRAEWCAVGDFLYSKLGYTKDSDYGDIGMGGQYWTSTQYAPYGALNVSMKNGFNELGQNQYINGELFWVPSYHTRLATNF